MEINNSTAMCVDLDLTDEEMSVFIHVLSSEHSHADWLFDFLYYIIGKHRFIKFLDLFESETFSVPSIQSTLRMIRDAKIYTRFVKERKKYDAEVSPEDAGLSLRPSPYAATAQAVGLRTDQVFKICLRLKTYFENKDKPFKNMESTVVPKLKRKSIVERTKNKSENKTDKEYIAKSKAQILGLADPDGIVKRRPGRPPSQKTLMLRQQQQQEIQQQQEMQQQQEIQGQENLPLESLSLASQSKETPLLETQLLETPLLEIQRKETPPLKARPKESLPQKGPRQENKTKQYFETKDGLILELEQQGMFDRFDTELDKRKSKKSKTQKQLTLF